MGWGDSYWHTGGLGQVVWGKACRMAAEAWMK